MSRKPRARRMSSGRCGTAAATTRLDGLLREGIEAMERQDLVAADATFTRLIEEAPAFAEGWNKRATVRSHGR